MIDFTKAKLTLLKVKYDALEKEYFKLKKDRDRMLTTLQKIEEGVYCHADACDCGLGSPKELARRTLNGK